MIRIVCVGKMKDRALQSLSAEYLKRISPFAKAEIVEVRDEPNTHAERDAEAARIKNTEADRVLAKLRSTDLVILLDLGGEMWNSERFAKQLGRWQERAGQKGGDLVFAIAGSLGPGAALLDRADFRWKLSDLTFTHLLTRVLILEQIYRGFTILHGRTYHK
ncbi:MAG: 23S rRNA (pseudouridine(1915)-N(3))-methyltransferase RlmH [Eubacteriales bacterium]|nr:23S rRNA (pseudouridine(1915)-N(3))-methyltransferase RlmH [Lachnospiraceae bacterium]MDO4417014.1 23S rRNA (pseudouridine(1915)-N(3))-methyltransferase RlmH [Eubacteriales bacterium]